MIKFTIGRKLTLGFGILLLFLIMIGFVSYFEAQTVIRDIQEITDKAEPKTAAAFEMEIHAIETEINILNYLFNTDPQARANIVKNDQDFKKFHNEYLQLLNNNQGNDPGEDIAKIYEELQPTGISLMNAKDYQKNLFSDFAEKLNAAFLLFDQYQPELTDTGNPVQTQKILHYFGLRTNFMEACIGLGNYLITEAPEYKDRISVHANDFFGHLQQWKSLPLTEDEKYWTQQISNLFSETHALTSEILGIEYAFNYYLSNFTKIRSNLHHILHEDVKNSALADLNNAKLEGIGTANKAKQMIISLICISVILCTAIVLLLTTHVTRSFKQLLSATSALGKGELTKRIPIKSKDEFGILGKSFNQMAADLERYIAEKTNIEISLRNSEKLFSNLFESIQDGVSILDRDLTIRQVNGVIKKWYPETRPLEGRKCHECYFSSQEPCEPCPALSCIDSGKIETNIVPGPAGSDIKWIELSAFPLTDPNSKEISGVVEFVRDITTEIQVVKNKRIAEERHRLILENARDAIIVAQDNVLKYCNTSTETILGYSKEELSCLPFMDIIHPDDQSKIHDRYTKIIEGQIITDYTTFRVKDKSEQELLLEINGVQIIWEKNPAALCFVRDVTQIKKMEKQIIQSHKVESIGTLAGGIAHDFNNILSSIVGYTELAIDCVQPDSVEHEYLQGVFTASMRARDLVDQILSFSRMGSQEKKPLMAHIVVKEAIKLLRASIPMNIEISKYISNNCGLILGDPTQIHQIVINLCTNAYHAMAERDGIIEITMSEIELETDDMEDKPDLSPGRYIRLSVNDNGKGMTSDIISRIFDPYFTTKESGKGTGLGLAVTYGIVKNHDGHISVYSEPGIGSTFNVYLPVIKNEELSNVVTIPQSIPTGNEHILLVDDEVSIADMEKQMLEKLGYHVTMRTGSVEALQAFRANPNIFDLVITDMTMPRMTGDQLAAKILSIRPDIPILVCTGFSERINKQKANATGIKGLLTKPVVKSDLARVIRRTIDEKDCEEKSREYSS